VAEGVADVAGRFLGDDPAPAELVPPQLDQLDDVQAQVLPEEIPDPKEQRKGDQRGQDRRQPAEEEPLEVISK
jgi:hypothetical protein